MSSFSDEPRHAAGFHVLIFTSMCSSSRTGVYDEAHIAEVAGGKPAENAAQQDKATKGHFRMETN